MKQKEPNLYEGMYVINAALGDDARRKVLEKIQEAIISRKGEIIKLHDQGRKRLAYEIAGQREGYYYVIYFKVEPTAISQLWEEYHLNEDLLRFITLTTDKVMEKIEFKALEPVE